MPEEFEEEQSTQGFDVQRYIGIGRRRHLHFLIPLFFGWIIVWGVSWVLPPRYQSSTLILVQQPTMPKDYVTPNVNDDLQQRLQSITEQILSRTRLLHIIDQFNLYASARAPRTADQKVEKMRKDISIELVRDNGNQITAFNISYMSRDPHTAQEVTSEITNLFINENLEVTQTQSQDTTKFLEGQLETARKSLSEQEAKVRQFKAEHVGEMPEQLATNLQILSGLQQQLQNEQDSLNAAKQQHVYLQALVDQYRATANGGKSTDGAPLGLPAIDDELDKLRTQLADLSSRYTDKHPDVRKLREQIAKTEKMREQLLVSLKAKKNDTVAGNDANPATADPARGAMALQIQGQVGANQVEITNRERSIAALKTKIDDYQGRLNQEPIREQQLADLTRGYEQQKSNYDDLLKKKNESAMATSMVLLQQGERFTIVDPPSLPQKPDFPNRLKFCGLGLFAGIALGCLVVGLLEFRDDTMYTESELKKILPAGIIAEIPAIITDADAERVKRRLLIGWATAAVVFGTILLGSAFSYLRG